MREGVRIAILTAGCHLAGETNSAARVLERESEERRVVAEQRSSRGVVFVVVEGRVRDEILETHPRSG